MVGWKKLQGTKLAQGKKSLLEQWEDVKTNDDPHEPKISEQGPSVLLDVANESHNDVEQEEEEEVALCDLFDLFDEEPQLLEVSEETVPSISTTNLTTYKVMDEGNNVSGTRVCWNENTNETSTPLQKTLTFSSEKNTLDTIPSTRGVGSLVIEEYFVPQNVDPELNFVSL